MLQAQVQYYIYTLILFYCYLLFFAVDEFCITNKPWDSSWAL